MNMDNKEFENAHAATEMMMHSLPTEPEKDPSVLSSDEIANVEGRANIVKMPSSEDIAKMNYVELQTAISDMKNIIHRSEETMSIINSLDNLFAENDTVDDEQLKPFGLTLEAFQKMRAEREGFKTSYNEKMPKHYEILSMLEKAIHEKYGSQEKTTSFMTAQLKEAFQKRIAVIDELIASATDDKYRTNCMERKKNLEAICEILDDRENLSYWAKRYNQRIVIHNTWVSVRKDYDHAVAYIKKHLAKTFHPATIELVYNAMIMEWESEATPIAAICVLYDMAKCARFGKESKEGWNVRNLLTAITDMTLGRYDYHCEKDRKDGIVWVSTMLYVILRMFSIEIRGDHNGKMMNALYKEHPMLLTDAQERIHRFDEAVKNMNTAEDTSNETSTVEPEAISE